MVEDCIPLGQCGLLKTRLFDRENPIKRVPSFMGGTDTIFILVPICSSSYFAMKYCSGEVGTGSVALLMLDGKLEGDRAVT